MEVVSNEAVVVRHFEWLVGSQRPSGTWIVWLREIVDKHWVIYDSTEDMREAYDNYWSKIIS